MPTVSSVTPFHFIGQDDQNEMQHDFFSHLTLAWALCDANGIVYSTIVLIRSRWLKQCTTSLFWSCNAIDASVSVMWCQQCHQWHIPFLRSRWSKGRCNDVFGYVIPVTTSVTPLHLFSQDNQNEVQHWVLVSHDTNGIKRHHYIP